MARVIIVGAGISGLACARELVDAGHLVSIRERAFSVGGRMASRVVNGRPVDFGASYFTAGDPDFLHLTEDWCRRGLARRWTDRFPALNASGFTEAKPGPWRYATPGGLRSLVADLANASPAPRLVTRSPVSLIEPGPKVDGEQADAVVLAMPDPQAKRLLDERLPLTIEQVSRRRWDPVLALTAPFARRTWGPLDGAFINDDPTLSWVADDGSRRGDGAAVLVAHSTPTFAAGHLDDPEAAGPELMATLDRLLGCGAPVSPRVHRWTFARPSESREEPFYFGAERVGLAGDGWGSARVETAWLSGRSLGRHLAAVLAGS